MSARRDDEATAEQLARRYRLLIEHSPDAICVHVGGTIVLANPALVRLLGARSERDLLGLSITTFVHPGSVDAMVERIAGLTQSGIATKPTEMDLVGLDGRTVPVESVSVLTEWQGEFAYQVVLRDLSAQRAAEAAVTRAEAFFSSVVDQLEEGVLVVDQSGRLESLNPAGVRILGLTDAGQVLGRHMDDLPVTMVNLDGEPLRAGQHPMAHTLASGEPVTSYVFGVVRPDESIAWLACNCRLLHPDSGSSAGVSSFADVTEHRSNRKQLEYQATHDALTGLANRSLVLSELDAALADDGGRGIATVLFIDLDGFKIINDTLGHAVGDLVLREIAKRLQESLRTEDLVGRLGGDEFLVLLAGHPDVEDVPAVVERLRATIGEPVFAHGHRLEVTGSIGVAELGPGEDRSAEAVLHAADLAMYRNKPQHREGGIRRAATP
ncbi:sensor domain-containing diguanylate cyclase [Nocardia camponoti]|uniref:Diguanylate cyclase n=1 Tax=Nocardia camponoti TaxID=1616106 RepID=A0A917QTQ3_9NOCA|nr:sensor domain-containing diguanylate cyclase [Nocardia camponoti]GGK67816.1 hypothetical protein GCM10011591_45010 [Nocardia camponoti]